MLPFDEEELNLKKIRWHCRRGMLELDVMLHTFFDQAFNELSLQKKHVFVKLLESTDQELYQWLIGHSIPDDPEFQDMILVIRHLSAVSENTVT
jgi:antitoxin CptB